MSSGELAEPCGTDEYYDRVGHRGHFRQSHSTADLIFKSFPSDGRDARIHQGGFLRANDLEFLKEISIGLVVNVASNIEAPPWLDQPDAPRWWHFLIPELTRGSPIFPVFASLYQVVSNALLRGENVFIHCRAGAHRAGTCVAAFAMIAYGLHPWAAVRQVKDRRSVTELTGRNFLLLQALHKELQQKRTDTSASAASAASSAAGGSSWAAASASSAASSSAAGSASAAASAAPPLERPQATKRKAAAALDAEVPAKPPPKHIEAKVPSATKPRAATASKRKAAAAPELPTIHEELPEADLDLFEEPSPASAPANEPVLDAARC